MNEPKAAGASAGVSSAKPLAVMVTRRARAGRETEFERLTAGMINAAQGFEGHLGGYLIDPEPGNPGVYRTLFAFDTPAHLRAWTQSAERRSWLDSIAEISDDQGNLRILSGLEGWFELPSTRTKTPPPRYKMAIVSWLGIFPLVLILSNTVGPLAASIHPILAIVAVTMLVAAGMTWLVAPFLTRLFAFWLYPKS